MKKTFNYIKNHWFKTSIIFLSVILTINLFIMISRIVNFSTQNNLKKDIASLETFNYDHTSESLLKYELNEIYNFYKNLGYNLEDETNIKTRQQVLGQIQDSFIVINKLEEYAKIKNIDNSELESLKSKMKTEKDPEKSLSIYSNYINNLNNKIAKYILENNLVDVENIQKEIDNNFPGIDETLRIQLINEKINQLIPEIIAKELVN